jgi:hypothetical protein
MCRDVPVFTLSLDGYADTKVPLNEVTGILARVGSIEIEHVKMRKIQSNKTVNQMGQADSQSELDSAAKGY